MCVNDTNRRVNATEKDVFLQKITKRCYPHYVKEDSILYFMYSESLCSPICWGQSILIKETPTPSHLYYTNERKECLLTQITKERMVSVPTDIAIISYTFSFVSAFLKILKIFFTEKDNLKFIRLPFLFFNACQYTLIVFDAFLYAIVLISTFQYNSCRDRQETTGNEFYHPIHKLHNS